MIPIAATEWFAGLPLAMIFLIVFSLNFAGGRNKWWWIIIPLLPAILFEIFIDPLHIYIPIILGLIAWGLGTMANKTLRKLAPSYMAKIAQKR